MKSQSLSNKMNKLYLKLNKSNSDCYFFFDYIDIIKKKRNNEISKINIPFTINNEYNKDFFNNAHRLLIHSKIKSNPKYNKLEIDSYASKKEKQHYNKNIFLTINIDKNAQKSRNKINFIQLTGNKSSFSKPNYNKRNKKQLYIINPSQFELNKYYLDTDRNINEFINERRIINKLKYINKIKYELKDKRENEIEEELKLYNYNSNCLLTSKYLLTKFEIDRNHYNRYLFNELIANKQTLLKIKLKQNIIEGEVTQLKKKIDDLKGKKNLLKEYKNFLLSVKYHISNIDNYFNKTIEPKIKKQKIDKKNSITISPKINKQKLDNNHSLTITPKNYGKNYLYKKESIKKRYSVFKPFLKQYINKNIDYKKDKIFQKETTFEYRKEENMQHDFSYHQKAKSDYEIFESSIDFYNKMNKIKNLLFNLIYKNNKISREIFEMKIKKKEEVASLKINSNINSKIKIFEELLNNYKAQNVMLEKKINLLTNEKGKNSFNDLISQKIKQILVSINNNFREFPQYDKIFGTLKKVLSKSKFKLRYNLIVEGIIIIENFIYRINTDINNYAKNSKEENIIENLKHKIEKEKKNNIGRHTKDEMSRNLKINKIIKKMNKLCITSRKVPEKINFFKKAKTDRKKKSKDY